MQRVAEFRIDGGSVEVDLKDIRLWSVKHPSVFIKEYRDALRDREGIHGVDSGYSLSKPKQACRTNSQTHP